MTLDDFETIFLAVRKPWAVCADMVGHKYWGATGPARFTEAEAINDAQFLLSAHEMVPKMIKVLKAAKVKELRFTGPLMTAEEQDRRTQGWLDLDAAFAALEQP